MHRSPALYTQLCDGVQLKRAATFSMQSAGLIVPAHKHAQHQCRNINRQGRQRPARPPRRRTMWYRVDAHCLSLFATRRLSGGRRVTISHVCASSRRVRLDLSSQDQKCAKQSVSMMKHTSTFYFTGSTATFCVALAHRCLRKRLQHCRAYESRNTPTHGFAIRNRSICS